MSLNSSTPLKFKQSNVTTYTDDTNNSDKMQSERKWCPIMSIISLLFAIVIVSVALTQQNNYEEPSYIEDDSLLCLWNATTSSYVNGQYLFNGISKSDYPMYSLSLHESCNIEGNQLYLFNSNPSTWIISSLSDKTSSTADIGECKSNTIKKFVYNCDGFWQIPVNNPQKNVVIMDNTCPTVSCDSLKVKYEQPLENETCIGTFDPKISDNLYQKRDTDLYLFFNPSLFRWVCGKRNKIQGCAQLNQLEGYSKNQSWFNADNIMVKNDTNISMQWSNGHKATIQCKMYPTAQPTAEPTPKPTTAPTRMPTSNPTAQPTTEPTHKPTTSPTRMPTHNPTVQPTAQPTAEPTSKPTSPKRQRSGCYAEDSLVRISGNMIRFIKDLKVGDYVFDGNGYTKIFYIDRLQDPISVVEMNKIRFGNPKYDNSLTLTPEHLLYKQGYELAVKSSEVEIGDKLMGIVVIDYNYTVYDISIVYEVPISPITNSGQLLVNGIQTSVYSHSMEEHNMLHTGSVIFKWISDNIDEKIAVKGIDFYYHIIYKNMFSDQMKSYVFGNSLSSSLFVIAVPLVFMGVIWKMSSVIKGKIPKNTNNLN